MKIIPPSYDFIDRDNLMSPEKKIETVGRLCYKSEDKITDTSAEPFVRGLIRLHLSPKGKALATFCQVLSEQTAVFAFPSGEGGSTRSGEADEAYTMGYR